MVSTARLFRCSTQIAVLSIIFVASSHAQNKPAVLSDISKQMLSFVEKHEISGAVTLVAKGSQVVHLEAVGLADIEANRPMEKDTIFAIASMTKPITATALMILYDEGRLSLEDPVAKHIPAFENVRLNGEPPPRPITVSDLITHTSGIGGSQQNQGALAETVDTLAAQPMKFRPGEKWQYSPGVTVCGRVVEVVADMPFERFLDARIFQPLRMKDTTFHPTPEQSKRIAKLYKPGPSGNSIEATDHWLSRITEDRSPNPSGGLFSTAADMAKFYQMILDGGEFEGRRIVSKKAVGKMTRIQTGELATGFTPGNGWGLGWCVVRKPQGVTEMLSPGTFGHGGAFGTQGWVDPRRRMIFVLMIQRTGFGNSDGADIRRKFQSLAVEALYP